MSKPFYSSVLLLAAVLLATSGCSKTEKTPPPAQIKGVAVDMPKLQQAFATNSAPEIQNQMTQIAMGMRYGDYMKALVALDKLANDPTTTEPQKKIVTEVIEQVKQVMNQAQPAPAQ